MRPITKKLQPLWAFLYYCLATVFMTYPLAFQMTKSIIGGWGDDIYFVWLIRWYQKVFFEGDWHPFFNPWMNYPQGWNLSTTDTSLSSALPGIPFSLVLGPVAGYNIAMLLTFVLSGFFMYLWVRSLMKSNLAGLLAGTIYAFVPDHIARLVAGHLNMATLYWFPLYFWGLYNLLRAGIKFDWKSILLTGFALGAIAFISMYYLYMTLLFTVVFVLVYLIVSRFKVLREKNFWLQIGAAALISLPFLYFSLRPFVTLSAAGGLSSRSVEYAAMYSASPTDFFLPSSDHFLFGAPLSKVFDRSLWMEGSLYIGLVGMVLGIIAIVRNKKSEHRWLIWSALAVMVTSFVLALGINLHWNNQDVISHIPAFLQPVLHRSETLIFLPSNWLFQHLPFYDKMRALMRFGLFVLIFVPVLAGIGYDQISKRLSLGRQRLLAAGLIAVVLFEFYPGSYAAQLSQPAPRPVDLWLAGQPGKGAVAPMPFSTATDQAQLYYTLFYNKPFVGGFFNANQPEQYVNISPVLDNFPDANSVELLRRLKVEYIVVDTTLYSDLSSVQHTMEQLGLVRITVQGDQEVWGFGE